jgi:hypothetical protein
MGFPTIFNFGSCMLPLEHIILIVSQTINTAVCSAKTPQQIPILVFSLTRLGLALTICRSQGKCTDAVCENRTDFATTNTDKTIHTSEFSKCAGDFAVYFHIFAG